MISLIAYFVLSYLTLLYLKKVNDSSEEKSRFKVALKVYKLYGL